MARIEVDPSFGFFPWKTFRKIANVNKQIADEMEVSGKNKGAKVSDWFCSFKPIPIDYWLRAQHNTLKFH
jgi:hypothetical protein